MKKILLAWAFFLALPVSVFAHATPTIYEPDSGARLEATPERITIVFSERVEERASSIVVFAADGSRAERGPARVDASDARRLSVELETRSGGLYTVSWQVVSADDGHFTKGAYAFGVGVAPASGAESFEVSHSSAAPEALALWLELVGQAILVAALVFYTLRRKFFGELADTIPERLRHVVIFGAWLVVASVCAFVILKTNQLAGARNVGFGEALVPFLSTNVGMAAIGRGFLALAALLFWQRMQAFVWLAVLGMVFLRSLISHAAASKTLPELSIAINTVHLFFKDLWIGSLIVAVRAALPMGAKIFLRSLSRLIVVSLFVAGITGVYIVWLHLKGFGNIFGTSWGQMFVILSFFGGLLFMARSMQWWILRMRPAESHRIPVLLSFEMFVGILVLFATAFIIITTPPLGSPETALAQFESNDANIKLVQRLAEPGTLFVEVESAVPVRNLVVTLTNSAYSIGPIVAPIVKRFEGGYAIPKDAITPEGFWRFDITAQREGVYDAVASYEGNWPHHETGRDKTLEILLIATLFSIVVLSGLLWRWTSVLGDLGDKFIIKKEDLLQGFILAAAFAVFIWIAHLSLLRSSFERACESQGDYWHTMQPTRNGAPLSDTAFEGCMTADGRNHFTDGRDYEYFKR